MPNRGRISFVAAGLALAAVAVIYVFRYERELVVRGQTVSQWALALRGPAPTAAAEEVLKSLGTNAVPDLVRMFGAKDSVFRNPVNFMVSSLPARPASRLRAWLKLHQPAEHREAAVLGLRCLGTDATPAIPALVEALRDPVAMVNLRAGDVLGRIGAASFPGLAATLNHPEPSIRRAAMIGLARLGSEAGSATPRLVELLRDPSDRAGAHGALAAIGKPAVPPLIESLASPSIEVRSEAMTILGEIGLSARAALPKLAELAADPSVNTRRLAVQALAQICRSCEPVMKVLQRALEDESWEIRRIAASHLSQEPRAARMEVAALMKKLESSDATVRRNAMTDLSLLGAAAGEAVPTLKKLAADDDPALSAPARAALGKINAAMPAPDLESKR